MAPGNTAYGNFPPQLSPGTFTSCPGSLLLLRCYHYPQIRALMGQKKVKGLLRNTEIQRQGTTVGFPGAFSKARVTYPHQVFQTSILTYLHSCPKVQQCYVPRQITSLPPKTSYHLCLPPALDECVFLHLINQTLTKNESVLYFSNAGWGYDSFCPSLLESPLWIYMYPSTFKHKTPILYHSLSQNNFRGFFKIDWEKINLKKGRTVLLLWKFNISATQTQGNHVFCKPRAVCFPKQMLIHERGLNKGDKVTVISR